MINFNSAKFMYQLKSVYIRSPAQSIMLNNFLSLNNKSLETFLTVHSTYHLIRIRMIINI